MGHIQRNRHLLSRVPARHLASYLDINEKTFLKIKKSKESEIIKRSMTPGS